MTVLSIAAAGALSLSQPKVYRAQTTIVVGQGGGIFQPQYGNVFQPFTQTMSSLLKSDVVANSVIRELGLDETPKSLLSHVNVSSTPSSAAIQVTFDSQNRQASVQILDTLANTFTSLVAEKLGGPQNGQQGGGQQGTGNAQAAPPITATVFDPAHASTTPISPRPARTMAFAGVVGLGLGILLALLRDTLDDRIRGRGELEEQFAAPVIAELPTSMLGRSALEQVGDEVPSSLRAVDPVRLQLSGNGSRGALVVITSSASGEGKSTVAANLGLALSLAGHDVICVDADPTPPRLTKYLELEGPPGPDGKASKERVDLGGSLRDVELPGAPNRANGDQWGSEQPPETGTQGSTNLAATARSRGPGRIQLLEWGTEQESRAQWAITDLAAELKERATYVLVDTPPVTSGTTLALLTIADETIVVTRDKKTTRAQARAVRDTLERLHVPNYSIVAIGPSSGDGARKRSGLGHIFSSRKVRTRR